MQWLLWIELRDNINKQPSGNYKLCQLPLYKNLMIKYLVWYISCIRHPNFPESEKSGQFIFELYWIWLVLLMGIRTIFLTYDYHHHILTILRKPCNLRKGRFRYEKNEVMRRPVACIVSVFSIFWWTVGQIQRSFSIKPFAT